MYLMMFTIQHATVDIQQATATVQVLLLDVHALSYHADVWTMPTT